MLVMEFVLTITSFFVPQCEAFFITRAYAQEVTTEEKNDTTQRKSHATLFAKLRRRPQRTFVTDQLI